MSEEYPGPGKAQRQSGRWIFGMFIVFGLAGLAAIYLM
jgi:hypothetical protein